MKKKKNIKIFGFLAICLLITIPLFLLFKPTKPKEVKKEEPKSNDEGAVETVITRKQMSIAMVGDSLIHGAVYYDANLTAGGGYQEYTFDHMFTYMPEMLANYDLRYVNQESIIGGKNLGIQHYPLFNSPDEIGDALVNAGFNMVSLANNHSLDQGTTGLLYSVEYWKNKGVINAGMYATEEDRDNIKIYEQNDIKFAFLSYTTVTNGLYPAEPYYLNIYSEELVKRDVDEARRKGAEVVIVAMHWGEEYTNEPVYEERQIAEYLSSIGVNLIIGAHPHVIQPIAYVGDTLVIYSLGNFISAQHPLGINMIIGLFVGVDIVVDDGKVSFENLNYELLYTYCTPGYRNFSVIPFSKLDDDHLPNHDAINEEWLAIVKSEGL